VRRAILALVGATAGTTLMIGAKLGTRPPVDPGALTAGTPADQAAGGDAAGAAAPTASITPSVPAAGVTASATPKPARPSGATRTTAPPPSAGAGTGLKNGTFAGPAVTERYGTITVTITVAGGRLTNLTASYPTNGETGQINANAIPRLRQQALTAQSARIATVSGATYTSDAYKQSLQGALDKAKA
jgi:uncharacterized protein with FMN-binding domain